MKIIICADIHLKHKWVDELLKWETPYDQAIFTGDFFHRWGDSVNENADTAHWLKDHLADPRHVCLWGNHDWGQCFWPYNEWAFCPGCDQIKAAVVRAALSWDDWSKFKLYHAIPEWNLLFSHAGLHQGIFGVVCQERKIFYPPDFTLPTITKWLDECWPEILKAYKGSGMHPLMEVAYIHGGTQKVGGITWERFDTHMPIEGIGQIIGHTIQGVDGPLFRMINREGAPMWRPAKKGPIKTEWLKQGWTLCMDTSFRHYGVLDSITGVLQIREINRFRNPGDIQYSVSQGKIIARIQLAAAV